MQSAGEFAAEKDMCIIQFHLKFAHPVLVDLILNGTFHSQPKCTSLGKSSKETLPDRLIQGNRFGKARISDRCLTR